MRAVTVINAHAAASDPEQSRAVLTSTTTEHVNRENAKAELLALLNDRTIKNARAKEHAQSAYDWLCGRKQSQQ